MDKRLLTIGAVGLYLVLLGQVVSAYANTVLGVLAASLIAVAMFVVFFVGESAAYIFTAAFFAAWEALLSYMTYLSDGEAIGLAAATYALATHNTPYSPAAAVAWWRTYPVEPWFWTQIVNGGYVARFIYPGGSALIYMLIAALAHTVQGQIAGIHMALAAATAASYLYMFYALRRRPEAAFFLAAITALAGFGEPLAAPLALAAAASAWGSERREGILWGLAASINQLYALAAIPLAAKRRFRAMLYMIATFLVVNAPFIAWGPRDWLTAMMFSALQPITPIGVFLGRLAWIGAASPAAVAYMVAVGAVVALVTAVLAGEKIRTPWLTYLSPILFLVFYTRTLLNYVPAFAVPAIVAAATYREERGEGGGSTWGIFPAVFLMAAVLGVFSALVYMSPPMLGFNITSVHLITSGGNITGLDVVINASAPQNVTIDLVPLTPIYVFSIPPMTYSPLWWTTCGTYRLAQGLNNITCMLFAQAPAAGRWAVIAFNARGYDFYIAK